MPTRALLILENGSAYPGFAMGAEHEENSVGEVVFNTALTGYQEILTDPSYCRQIVVMTAAQIGNTGANQCDNESARPHLKGFVVRDFSRHTSSWRSEESLQEFLRRHRIPGICGVDTRALVKEIRETGCLRGQIRYGRLTESEIADTTALLKRAPAMEGSNLVDAVATRDVYIYASQANDPYQHHRRGSQRRLPGLLGVIDFGCKRSIFEQLSERVETLKVYPPQASASDILRDSPKGIVLSNGPGDPAAVENGITLARDLLEAVPLLGICLGYQILGLAFGLPTFKLRFGHHGGNHPVKTLETNEIAITSQNHNFAVDRDACDQHPDLAVTHVNLNDQTLEGFRHRRLPIQAVQYHPEGAPGPLDSRSIFDRFVEDLRHGKISNATP